MKIYKEDGVAIPAVQVLQDADPAPTGFTEVTDIWEAYTLGAKAIDQFTIGWRDRLCLRTKLKGMIYAKMGVAAPADIDDQTKWDLLSAQEKQVATLFFVVSKESFFLEVHNDLLAWTVRSADYRKWTMAARENRAALAESILFMRLQNLGDAKLCLADLNQIAKDTVIDIDDVTKKTKGKSRIKTLNRQYVEGLEDEEHDGVVAVKDWIQSTVGTPYETNGFMNLSYPFKGTHTAASVRDEMLDALEGNY